MYINSMGHYVPHKRIDNSYFTDINGLTSEWIVQRTGIETRSRAEGNENYDTMGLAAVDNAISRGLPYDVTDVDLIISTGYSVYDTVATLAHQAQRRYGIHGAKAFYMSAACSSFINALETADAYFKAGLARRALIICSEHNSYYADETDPKSGHLWGDAAVAWFVSADKQCDADWKVADIFTEGLGAVGKGPDGVRLRVREDGIRMPDGRDVFIHACRYMIYALNHTTENAGLKIDDIDRFICHQANKRIVAQVAHQLEKEADCFINNIERLGNTGSASAPLVLSESRDAIPDGGRVALMVFGGGYSCGAFIVEKP